MTDHQMRAVFQAMLEGEQGFLEQWRASYADGAGAAEFKREIEAERRRIEWRIEALKWALAKLG